MGLDDALFDEARWVDGSPPERALITLFAAASPDTLAVILKRMLSDTFDEVVSSPSTRARLEQKVTEGGDPSEQGDDLAFAGADYLVEAIQAADSSVRLHKVALKSLGHALAAVEAMVAAIVESRDHRRDPVSWRTFRDAIESEEPTRQLTALAPEHQRQRAEDRREAWRRVLAHARVS